MADDFAKNLKRVLKEKRLSARAAAEGAGIPSSNLADWLSGRSPRLTDKILKLCKFLDVTVEELMTGSRVSPVLKEDELKRFLSTDENFVSFFNGVYRVQLSRLKDEGKK